MSKAMWYMNRLRAMSLPEIGHRVREQGLRRRGRTLSARPWQGDALHDLDAVGMPVDPVRFDAIAAECAADWREQVARALAGNWRFLGQDWDGVQPPALWHHDPATGTAWERDAYCYDISYRHRADRGDIKHLWEVNRLQILPVAAALWRSDNDEQARDLCLTLMDSWIAANPPWRGVNWNSGIELSLRIVNLSAALGLLGADAVPAPLAARVLDTLQAHVQWVHRYPSRFSSSNNHLIAELASLHIAARTLPGLHNGADLGRQCWDELMDQVLTQIHPDGVGAEQSPTYTCFTLEWVLLSLSVGAQSGDEVPDAVTARLIAAARHLRWMMDKNGNVPRIGDDDEGRVILSGPAREADYVGLILGSLSAMLNTPEHAPPVTRPHLRQLWTGQATPAPTSAAPQGAEFFDAGGYTVFRHMIQGRESILAMDHGPLGYLSIAAHGHADALAVWWHLDGQPVLVDAGTYLYHSGGAMRDAFRGTPAHNTLSLDDADQSTISGAFNWSHKARTSRIAMSETVGGLCSVAHHDGYRRRFGVEHQRKIALNVPNGYTIRDRLTGTLRKREATARLRYMLHPDLMARIDDNAVFIADATGRDIARLTMAAITQDALSPPETPHRPVLGEQDYSPDFGELRRTQVISLALPAADLMNGLIQTRLEVLA